VTPCGNMVRYQRFGGPCCLHSQGEVNDTATGCFEADFLNWPMWSWHRVLCGLMTRFAL